MRRTARLSLAVAGLAAFGLALPASAATAPTTLVITDPAGDSLAPATLTRGTDDIVKLTWRTSGTTTSKMVGKKVVKTYTPKALVVVVETTGNIDTSGTTQYDIEGVAAGCGGFYLYVAPGAAMESVYGSCADDDATDFSATTFVVAGKTLTFTIPLGSVPGIKAGGALTGLSAYTGNVDPVTGEFGPVLVGGLLANDDVSSDATYKIG